jgi:hypothetical protein
MRECMRGVCERSVHERVYERSVGEECMRGVYGRGVWEGCRRGVHGRGVWEGCIRGVCERECMRVCISSPDIHLVLPQRGLKHLLQLFF